MKLRYRPGGLRPPDPLRGAGDSLLVAGASPPEKILATPLYAYIYQALCCSGSIFYSHIRRRGFDSRGGEYIFLQKVNHIARAPVKLKYQALWCKGTISDSHVPRCGFECRE